MSAFPPHSRPLVPALCVLLLVLSVGQAAAQSVPDAGGTPAPRRLAVAGELTATYGSDDPGFFNYATYAYDPLRNVRVVIDAAFRAARPIDVLAQVRTDGLSQARLAALYVRIRPWRDQDIDVQAGRVPTAFGLFGRNGYGGDSPLIGRPFAYGYLLSLRRDAAPATTADLVRMRGRGWLSSFPRGNTAPDRGLPIVNADTWDTGVQLRVARGVIDWTGAVTAGSLGSPRFDDDNGGRAVSTRLVVRAHPGIALGLSAASGAYLSRSLDPVLLPGESTARLQQRAAGVDVDLASGRWRARAEVLASRWQLPALATGTLDHGVTAVTGWAEGRVRVLPGIDVAVRADHVGFSDVETPSGRLAWEAPVSRLEAGVAFVPTRHVRLKGAVQRNRRPDGGRVRHDTLFAVQAGVWF